MRLLAGCAMLCAALATTRAADDVIAAGWRSSTIDVDGALADWNRLEPVRHGPLVAAQNDQDALYLVVASDDATVRRQLATGLIVWMDASDRRAQTFGLRLDGPAPPPLPTPAAAGDPSDLPPSGSRTKRDAFDLLGPAKHQRRLVEQAGERGLALASGIDGQSVVFELKVPLDRTAATPYAVGARPGTTIALGLETPAEPKRRDRDDGLQHPMATTPWVNDPRGGYFNPPPPTNSADQPAREKPLKPMKLAWVSVKLAAAPGVRVR